MNGFGDNAISRVFSHILFRIFFWYTIVKIRYIKVAGEDIRTAVSSLSMKARVEQHRDYIA